METCRQEEVELTTCPLKPRSQALSLSSTGSADLGYESDWEYCDTEEEGEEDEEWEYFLDVPALSVPPRDLQSPYSQEPVVWSPGQAEQDIAARLRSWLARMRDKEDGILVSLEEQFRASQKTPGRTGEKTGSLRPSLAKFLGPVDRAGRPHGAGEARFTNGSVLSATFQHGQARGPGVLELLNGDKFEGDFEKSQLCGWVTETYQETGWRQSYYQAGTRLGYYREISPCGSGLEFGVLGGPVWRQLEGGALLVGRKDAEGKISDPDGLYLYPGFLLGISGAFERGKLTSGRECLLTDMKYDSFGLPSLAVSQVRNSRLLAFESPGTHIPARNCNTRDLWDILHVYVGQSRALCAGEGLFARRDIKKGDLVALFSGARKRHFRNETFEWSDYCIKVDESCSIDIPDFYIDVGHYSATLAHKACHSFTPNSRFDCLYHPRFGKIMAIFAKQDLRSASVTYIHYFSN